MKPTCSIIIPTFNNPEYFNPCVRSILATGVLNGLCELIVVNNGQQPIKEWLKGVPNTRVLEPGKNLGWEHGLQYGLDQTDTEFVCFQNDDTLIPKATHSFYSQLLWPFHNKNIAAVGPATTIAAGRHSIFQTSPVRILESVPYLIFFTVMLKRADLIAAGGIDTSCPGGDDLDLSIRLRKLGKQLVINPDAFLIHHAFKTGERVRGGPDVAGGWNSKEMTDRTNQWLIQKHGFSTYLELMRGFQASDIAPVDKEGELVASFVQGEKILELGCGFRKTVAHAIGLDRIGKGEPCNNIEGPVSVADVVTDVTKPLPFEPQSVDTIIARHILEHCIDSIRVLRQWQEVLKVGGRLIVAVPNQDQISSIPLNPEHVCAYTPQSLVDLMTLLGWKLEGVYNPMNGISFVAVFEKTQHQEGKLMELVRETVNA